MIQRHIEKYACVFIQSYMNLISYSIAEIVWFYTVVAYIAGQHTLVLHFGGYVMKCITGNSYLLLLVVLRNCESDWSSINWEQIHYISLLLFSSVFLRELPAYYWYCIHSPCGCYLVIVSKQYLYDLAIKSVNFEPFLS